MGILGALFSELKGAFGKTFLLAGMLPALAFLFGVASLHHGLRGALEQAAGNPTDLGVTAVVAVGAALAFFAARGVVLLLFQELPGPVLGGLRRTLRARKQRTLERWDRESEERRWRIAAGNWDRLGFQPATHLPPWIDPPTPGETVKRSAAARKRIGALTASGARTPLLTAEDSEEILEALADLYAVTGAHGTDAAVATEVEAWKALFGDPVAKRIIRRIAEHERGRWARGLIRLEQMPEPATVQPTRLGNRFAGLERYGASRYGIGTSVLWIRLVGVISPAERQEVGDARLAVEALANLAIGAFLLAGGAALAALLELVFYGPGAAATSMLYAAGAAALGPLFLSGADHAAAGLAEKVIRMIDLHRLALLKALGYAPPATVGDEVRAFEELHAFLLQGNPRDTSRKLLTP